MKTNKDSLRSAMDRRLSFLDELPSCRAGLYQRIAQEEAPVMKRKISIGLVFALVLVSLSVIAVATGLILSPRVSAATLAGRVLEEKYGITEKMNTFFGREEEELPDGTVKVTWFGAGSLEAPLGIYTVDVKDGKAAYHYEVLVICNNTADGFNVNVKLVYGQGGKNVQPAPS